MSTFWNERFAEPGFKYGIEPNAFLKASWPQMLQGLLQSLPANATGRPLRVLVPGDGEGRNGVWLAAQGIEVLAVDSSDVGLAKARSLAASLGPEVAVRYQTEVADLADWAPEPGAWDALVLIYTHMPTAIRQSAHRRLAQGLRPGGQVLLEAFQPQQWTELRGASGGPRDVDMLYTLPSLNEDFSPLCQPSLAEEASPVLNEGPGHQGPARVVRWVGTRSSPGHR